MRARWFRPGTWRRRPVLLLLTGYALIVSAWIWGDPLGAKPDESDHYTRALSVGSLHWVSPTLPTPPPPPSPAPRVVRGRLVEIPAGLAAPPSWLCNVGQPAVDGGCHDVVDPASQATTQLTNAVGYIPVGYLLPGIASRFTNDPATALRVGRIVTALTAMLLLASAVRLLFERESRYSILGCVIAISPMTLYLASEIGPNGLEIPAAIAFFAGMIRLSRRWALNWPACLVTAFAGFVLASDRPLGPLWVGVGLVLVAVEPHAIGQLAEGARRAPAKAAALMAFVVGGSVFNVIWDLVIRKTGSSLGSSGAAAASIATVLDQFIRYFREMVGVFGWAEVVMAEPAYFAWELLVVAVLVLALVVGTRRQRFTLVSLFVGAFLVCTALAAYYGIEIGEPGGGFQGRYILPWAVAIPLYSGEILYRNRARWGALEPRFIVAYAAALTAAVQVIGFHYNARREAVGADGPLNFFGHSHWQPVGGWMPWYVVVVAGAILISASAGFPGRDRDARERLQSAPP